MNRIFLVIALAIPCLSHADTFDVHSKRFRVGPHPTSVVIADMNGDGIPDLLTSNRGRLMDIREERPAEDHVSYLIGRGDLVFESQPPLPCGFGPYQVVVANIDALKAPDVIVASFHAVRNRDLTLLRNIGDGLFEPHSFSVVDDGLRYTQERDAEGLPLFSTPGLTSLAIADIDRDGYRDAVATGWSSDVIVVFPGHPEDYFDTPEMIELNGGPRDLVLRDLDGDGELDLAVSLYNADAIALLRGDGEGHFELADRIPAFGEAPHTLRYGDVNGDGRGDFIVLHAQGDDAVTVLYGEGGFGFSVGQNIRLGENRFQREFGVRDVVCADFTGDGKCDLILACPDAGSVLLLRNVSHGSSIPQEFETETYQFEDAEPYALDAQDLNGDEKPDVAVALWKDNAIGLLIAND
jgi:hypothetical protein